MTRKARIFITSATALVTLACAQSQVAPQPAELQSSVPVGTRIAFGYGDDLYTMNPDGSDIENLTEHVDQFVSQPDWSPDGKRLLLYCGDFDICVINHDGSGFRQLTDTPRWHAYGGPKWSLSGQRFAFGDSRGCPQGSERCARFGHGPNAGIYVMRLDGSHKKLVYPHSAEFDWSSTGWIAFSKGQGIVKIRPDGSQFTRLSRGGDTAPSWSADGKWIVFERITDPNFYGDVYKMRADGSDEQELVPGSAHSPSWSPTGRWVLFVTSGGPVSIWKIRSDGTDDQGLTDGNYPVWQPKATGPGRSEGGLGGLEFPTPSVPVLDPASSRR